MEAKRVADVAVAGAGLLLTAPLQALIAGAVRLDSPGPALFRQTRVGRGGAPFTILKFRTMRTDPVRVGGVTATGDPRVTRVGRVLRATKLDELPQLVNVVRGDMSLVGPRPELPRYVELWEPARRDIILSVRPGITDPASVAFRDEGSQLAAAADPERHYVDCLLPLKTAMYVDYVRSASWRTDLGIVLQTARALLGRAGGPQPVPVCVCP